MTDLTDLESRARRELTALIDSIDADPLPLPATGSRTAGRWPLVASAAAAVLVACTAYGLTRASDTPDIAATTQPGEGTVTLPAHGADGWVIALAVNNDGTIDISGTPPPRAARVEVTYTTSERQATTDVTTTDTLSAPVHVTGEGNPGFSLRLPAAATLTTRTGVEIVALDGVRNEVSRRELDVSHCVLAPGTGETRPSEPVEVCEPAP